MSKSTQAQEAIKALTKDFEDSENLERIKEAAQVELAEGLKDIIIDELKEANLLLPETDIEVISDNIVEKFINKIGP